MPNLNLKDRYHQFYGLARLYWQDMQQSGLDRIEKQKRRAYEVAATRVGFPLSYSDRLYATCFDDNLVAHGHMYQVADIITGCLIAAREEKQRLHQAARTPVVLKDGELLEFDHA